MHPVSNKQAEKLEMTRDSILQVFRKAESENPMVY